MDDPPAVVWVKHPKRRRRTTALRIGRSVKDGSVGWLVWLDGSLAHLSDDAVGRPRRNGLARILFEELMGEYRAYLKMVEGLMPRGKRR